MGRKKINMDLIESSKDRAVPLYPLTLDHFLQAKDWPTQEGGRDIHSMRQQTRASFHRPQ